MRRGSKPGDGPYATRRQRWIDRLPEIRQARARNVSYTEIGEWYGVSRCMVYLICKRHGIKAPKRTSAASRRKKREYMRRAKPALVLMPIDPHKAAAITEAKRDYWLNGGRGRLGRSEWVHPYARRRTA